MDLDGAIFSNSKKQIKEGYFISYFANIVLKQNMNFQEKYFRKRLVTTNLRQCSLCKLSKFYEVVELKYVKRWMLILIIINEGMNTLCIVYKRSDL